MMSFGFRSQSHKESCFQILVTASFSKNFLYINLFIRKEACSDLTIGGQSESIAITTEVAADRTDQSNLSKSPFKPKSQGRAIPLI